LHFIEKGLKKFAKSYKERGITSIAFPQLGSSLGGLDWETEVHPIMKKYLEGLDNLEVEIFSYDPKIADNDFIKLETKTNRFKPEDFVTHIKLNKTQANTLYEALKNKSVSNSMDIHNLHGFADKTLFKIKDFISSNEPIRVEQEGILKLFEDE